MYVCVMIYILIGIYLYPFSMTVPAELAPPFLTSHFVRQLQTGNLITFSVCIFLFIWFLCFCLYIYFIISLNVIVVFSGT